MPKCVIPLGDIVQDAEDQGIDPQTLMANPKDVVAAVDSESIDDDEFGDETDD